MDSSEIIRILLMALRFYSNQDRYESFCEDGPSILIDKGETARLAIADVIAKAQDGLGK
jgi:hypothetical protein